MLLCDSAQAVGGKLYILGGGWTHIVQNIPAPMALAVRIRVPWDLANHPFNVHIRLITDEGDAVDLGQGPVESRARIEVGRPPGMRRGAPLVSVLALNVAGVVIAAGRYVWELDIDGTTYAREPFEVLEQPAAPMIGR
jgi:hypothetical protein